MYGTYGELYIHIGSVDNNSNQWQRFPTRIIPGRFQFLAISNVLTRIMVKIAVTCM